MLDKTIDSALQQLYRQAISGGAGLDHILALMQPSWPKGSATKK